MSGKVYLVGCGPGAADLLTLRAVKALRKADVVLYDRLVDPTTIKYASGARKIQCGKRPGEHLKQDWINRTLYTEARKGKTVVRLKNGDPMVFGRGGEELQFLQEHGVDVEVIPGLSTAISIPTMARIPLTQRGISSSFTVLTGHRAEGRKQRLRCVGDTLVVLMAVKNLATVVRQLTRAGKSRTTPCALISWGATEKEMLAVSTLVKICDFSRRLGMTAPAVLIVGDVVNSALNFKGRRVAAFRSSNEVGRTKRLIRRVGGTPAVFGICKTMPAGNELKRAAMVEWKTLVFTSASGVRSAAKFFDIGEHKLIAIGDTTRMELVRRGHRNVSVPKTQNLYGVRALLRAKRWGRTLAFRSPLADEKLEGATNIVAYRVMPQNLKNSVRKYLRTKNDFTLLTSSGLLRYMMEAAERLGLKRRFVDKVNRSFVISLGAGITNYALRNGIWVNYEPDGPSLESLFKVGD